VQLNKTLLRLVHPACKGTNFSGIIVGFLEKESQCRRF
jgi:hypothetical protein